MTAGAAEGYDDEYENPHQRVVVVEKTAKTASAMVAAGITVAHSFHLALLICYIVCCVPPLCYRHSPAGETGI